MLLKPFVFFTLLCQWKSHIVPFEAMREPQEIFQSQPASANKEGAPRDLSENTMSGYDAN